ncbi:MAG: hypothetical protein WB586_30985 [Chthoniobacterales bacterium]
MLVRSTHWIDIDAKKRSVLCPWLGLLCLLSPKLCAADDLLILALFARVTPAGQVEPVPDPFIESILNRGTAEPSQGVQVLQGETYQISSWPKDFASEFDGIQGQRVVVSFTALVHIRSNRLSNSRHRQRAIAPSFAAASAGECGIRNPEHK